ncbi:ankyrin [Zopfia rhizophila CBS 207.26]|uniref:Ankyrin n=1 Tax=Zopfia rhizophila CBS 207.26 TaxID=1314779 RepID=A0A6A6E7T3_9PEZI|nr:ankyrin [Zopfia rhizophila CBS 207.26]
MSLGIGAGDFITIPALAWKVYRMCKDSSDEFKRVSIQLQSLHTALLETQEQLDDDIQLSRTRKDRLAKLKDSIMETLTELQALLDQYESMSTPAQSAWDRMRWGMQDVSSIRDRIIASTTELQVLNQLIHNSSQKTINKKLSRLLREVRAGYREGSCVSVQTVDSIDTIETWNDLRRELESVGLTTAAITENQEYITSWFQNAISKGFLQEQHPSAEEFINPFPSSSTSPTRADATFTESQARKQSEGSISSGSTTSPSGNHKSSTGSAIRKKSRLASVAFKMFRSDSLLLQAASDGDIERVADLISKGADVNVKDRWGWAPISMAAYGGHDRIALVLIDAEADLDFKDVDGDNPLQLAIYKGHTSVALLIEEEMQRRTIKGA